MLCRMDGWPENGYVVEDGWITNQGLYVIVKDMSRILVYPP